jgi:uncharacterized protein YbjT (DUF2867 family)
MPMISGRSSMKTAATVVTGASGKTGRRVAERLGTRGVPVRAGSRSGATPFDWEDDSTWEPALRGVDAAYVTYAPDLAAPGGAEAIETLTGLTVDGGVGRLVLLSGRGDAEAQAAERIVQGASLDWTIVRSSFFAQNFSESFFLDDIVAGEVTPPVADVPEPFVDVEDIADVA